MLQLSAKLFNTPIISIRTAGPVGTAIEPVINPNNLKIEGWYAVDRFNGQKLVLPASEVREIMPDGLAVNDHDAMTEQSEMVRLQKIIQINFKLIGKTVMTEKRKKIGKVNDFAFDPTSLYIQTLYLTERGLKALAGNDRIIGRGQIVQISDKAIVVRDTDVTVSFGARVPAAEPSRQPAAP